MKLIYTYYFLILVGCTAVDVKPVGIVEGKVSIGPLCGYAPNPNSENPCGLTNEELDGIYGKYTVVLRNLSSSVNSVSLRRKLDRTGLFSFEIEEGEYSLKLESSQQNALIFSDKESIEKTVKVSRDKKVFIELDVNTGIPSK
jgi:hypothetical protein